MINYRNEYIAMATIVINYDLSLFPIKVSEDEVAEYLRYFATTHNTTERFVSEVEEYLMYCYREETDIGFKQYMS
ncbi:MAG: hypothetical protein IKL07_08040, partial [Clostridium sp.]|nr:hypothetical protein [Clostridium sp.]